jgi:hypothetical protein
MSSTPGSVCHRTPPKKGRVEAIQQPKADVEAEVATVGTDGETTSADAVDREGQAAARGADVEDTNAMATARAQLSVVSYQL